MNGENIARKTVLAALAIAIAVWATLGPPEPSSNSPVHVASRR